MYAEFKMAQLEMTFRSWGGRRKGAGRPKGKTSGVQHLVRAPLPPRFPVHVTWRMNRDVWNLRSKRCFRVVAAAMGKGGDRFGFRLVHYAVMGNHIHMLVEGADRRALGRGMKGLGVRIARGLNRVMRRRGNVVPDRYHARILRTPAEVRNARRYLLGNARHHYGLAGPDPYASQRPLHPSRTYLLRLVR